MASGGDVLMLGVSGMRGIVGTSLTAETVSRFAGALGTHLRRTAPRSTKDKPAVPVVVLARDGRAGGDVLMHAASAGLRAVGCNVTPATSAAGPGIAMTPSIGFIVDQLGAAGGLVLTASHNPQQWNGCKAITRDGSLAKGRASASAPGKGLADQIIALYQNDTLDRQPWDKLGRELAPVDAGTLHARHVVELSRELGALKGLKKSRLAAVVDSVGGSGTLAGPDLLGALGCRATAMYTRVGLFPHTPEPTAANLTALCRAVKKHKAAVGFAQDPDADRLAIVDERGRYIGEEYTLVLACRALFEIAGVKRGSTVAVNLSTSRMIDDLAAKHGATVLRTPVGEANVVEAMKRERSLIGGEGNGGVIWPRITYIRDSLGAMALVLALVAKTGKTISQLVAEMPTYAIEKRKVDLAHKDHARLAVEKIARHYASERVDTQDGVRVDFAARSAWVHVRASNTEPIMRLIAEAPTAAAAAGLLDEVAGVIAR
ncbi:MAG: phosphoglucosamine mutase [Phycisphaerales bacterium]